MIKNQNSPLVFLALALLSSMGSWSDNERGSTVTIDGVKTLVTFNDGDTFKILEGNLKGKRVRLMGFNALESYGPVHQWGQNTFEYLYIVSQEATLMARQGSWNCKLDPGQDSYGRLLASCDDLAKALIGSGLAHAFSMNEKPAKKSYLTRQKKAQAKKLGMWKYGTPSLDKIITSIHSADEGAKTSYNRAIDTKDGHTEKLFHQEIYTPCQKVCIGESSSCMVHVPFKLRYGVNRPECLFVNDAAPPAPEAAIAE